MKLTRRNSSSAGVSAFHCAGGRQQHSGTAASRSLSAAISACFSTRRCNCQIPRAAKAATIASVKMAKPAAPRRRERRRSFRLAIDQPAGVRPCDGTAARSEATSSSAAATAWSRGSAAATAPHAARTAAGISPPRSSAAADDDGARNHDDEDRRPVAGIDEGVVEPAGLAVRPQIEEARIELARCRSAGSGRQCRAMRSRSGWVPLHLAWLRFKCKGASRDRPAKHYSVVDRSFDANRAHFARKRYGPAINARRARPWSRRRGPDIDADEQEQPHHVDEVPVPGGELEAEMLGRA